MLFFLKVRAFCTVVRGFRMDRQSVPSKQYSSSALAVHASLTCAQPECFHFPTTADATPVGTRLARQQQLSVAGVSRGVRHAVQEIICSQNHTSLPFSAPLLRIVVDSSLQIWRRRDGPLLIPSVTLVNGSLRGSLEEQDVPHLATVVDMLLEMHLGLQSAMG